MSEEDRALFRAATGGVRRLSSDVHPHAPPRRTPRLRAQPPGDLVTPLREPSSAELEQVDELAFRRDGVPTTTLRRLRRGQFPCEARLDLHGLTVADAKAALAAFLHQARRRVLRCVLIIHGKGYRSPSQAPVLKPRVAFWLAHSPDVVAYVSAPAAAGGTGALLVLLKCGR